MLYYCIISKHRFKSNINMSLNKNADTIVHDIDDTTNNKLKCVELSIHDQNELVYNNNELSQSNDSLISISTIDSSTGESRHNKEMLHTILIFFVLICIIVVNIADLAGFIRYIILARTCPTYYTQWVSWLIGIMISPIQVISIMIIIKLCRIRLDILVKKFKHIAILFLHIVMLYHFTCATVLTITYGNGTEIDKYSFYKIFSQYYPVDDRSAKCDDLLNTALTYIMYLAKLHIIFYVFFVLGQIIMIRKIQNCCIHIFVRMCMNNKYTMK